MNHTLLIMVILYEVISVVFIYRLWVRKYRPGILERCVLSIVLLVPFLGWIFYGFLGPTPETHGEDLPECDYDSGSGYGHHGGGHDGAGHH